MESRCLFEGKYNPRLSFVCPMYKSGNRLRRLGATVTSERENQRVRVGASPVPRSQPRTEHLPCAGPGAENAERNFPQEVVVVWPRDGMLTSAVLQDGTSGGQTRELTMPKTISRPRRGRGPRGRRQPVVQEEVGRRQLCPGKSR